jgi:hypothetical protein
MGYKIGNCNPDWKQRIARLHPTTPHSRYPSGGPGNILERKIDNMQNC